MQVAVLGPLRLECDGNEVDLRGRKRRAVLAILAVNANHVVSVDRLVEELWDDDPPRAAVGTIQTYVSQLRRALGPDAGRLTTELRGYRLALDETELDCLVFERTLARAVGGELDASEVAASLSVALDHWRGPALDDFRGSAWADAEAVRLDDLRATALTEWAGAALSLGQHLAASSRLEKVIGDFPYHETLRGQLMTALYRSGRQVEALAQYRDLRERLGEELGLEPGVELVRLESSILRHDDALQAPAADVVPRDGAPLPPVAQPRLVTFLFTDVVGSTDLWEREPRVAAVRMRAHLEAVRSIIEAHDGHVFKTAGDSAHAVFDRPGAAVAAAMAVQTEPIDPAARATDAAIVVRVGVYTGEAHPVDGDWLGRPLNRCARLAALAHAGQILVSHATAVLLAGEVPVGAVVEARGPVSLRGVPEPEVVHEIVLGRPPAAASGDESGDPRDPRVDAVHAPFPDELVLGDRMLVGRDDEVSVLEDLATELCTRGAPSARLALVVGEAGIGKTSLAARTAEVAARLGALVLFGRSDAEIAPAHEPVLRALTPLLVVAPPEVRAKVDALVGGTMHAAARDAQRLEAYDAIADLLRRTASSRPVLLVLDDLQWASPTTLVLARHLMATVGPGLLVIGTARDTADEAGGETGRLLSDVRALPQTVVVAPAPLSLADVTALTAGAPDGADVAAHDAVDLLTRSGGNPFFLHELIRGRTSFTGSALDAVGRRIARLSPATRRVLATAAIVGHSFTVPVVEHAHGGDALDALDEAVGARLVRELPSRPGGHEFVHGLVREAIIDELSAARRARLHRRVGEAVQALEWRSSTAESDARSRRSMWQMYARNTIHVSAAQRLSLLAVAHHYAAGADDGERPRAALFCDLAAREAAAQGSHELAVELARAGLDLLEPHDAGPRRRASLLLISYAALDNLMRRDELAAIEPDLVDAARASDDPVLLADVAYATSSWATVDRADGAVQLCREALAELPDTASDLRAMVLSALAVNLWLSSHPDDAVSAGEEAVAEARRTGERGLVGTALFDLGIALGGRPHSHPRRRAIAQELLDEGRAHADAMAVYHGARLGMIAGTEAADVAFIDECFDAMQQSLAGRRRPPRVPLALVSMWRAMFDLAAGRFADADARAVELREREGSEPNFAASAATLRLFVARDRGEAVHRLDTLRSLAARDGAPLITRAVRALVALDAGDLDEAAAAGDALAHGDDVDLVGVPRDAVWTASLAVMAEVARAVGTDARRAALIDHLRPHTGLLLVNTWGVMCHGAADRYLGGLLVARGEIDDGIAHLERGIEVEERLMAGALVARSRLWLAEAFRERGTAADHDRAAVEARRAGDTAAALGMDLLAAAASELLA